jgi:hypothetical protein
MIESLIRSAAVHKTALNRPAGRQTNLARSAPIQ